jgi:hypothetical protein
MAAWTWQQAACAPPAVRRARLRRGGSSGARDGTNGWPDGCDKNVMLSSRGIFQDFCCTCSLCSLPQILGGARRPALRRLLAAACAPGRVGNVRKCGPLQTPAAASRGQYFVSLRRRSERCREGAIQPPALAAPRANCMAIGSSLARRCIEKSRVLLVVDSHCSMHAGPVNSGGTTLLRRTARCLRRPRQAHGCTPP